MTAKSEPKLRLFAGGDEKHDDAGDEEHQQEGADQLSKICRKSSFLHSLLLGPLIRLGGASLPRLSEWNRVPGSMKGVAALLAAALLLAGAAGCGGSGAEPGAPQGATLVLDFTPNAVHSGIYAAQREGYYGDAGLDLTVRQPGESTDAPKLLAAGRTDFAILDIHDLGIARERGLDVVGAMPLVQRPLAAVIARRRPRHRAAAQLEGRTAGVTGLPSDEAVVDSEVSADGGNPAAVKRVTIGFNAISSLAAGRVDAATGFWNAEGVELQRQGVPIRIFKVNQYGAPPYPELILTTQPADDRRQASACALDGRGDEARLRIHGRAPRAGPARPARRSAQPRAG